MKSSVCNTLLVFAAAGISALMMSCASGNVLPVTNDGGASKETTGPVSVTDTVGMETTALTTAARSAARTEAVRTTPQTTPAQTTTRPQTTAAQTTAAQTTPVQTTPAQTSGASTSAAADAKPETKPLTTALSATRQPESRPAKETPYTATMYINQNCAAHAKADVNSPAVRRFSVNDAVDITASSDNGFYRLKSGGYLPKEYLCPGRTVVFSTSTSQSDAVAIPRERPSSAGKTCDFYDPAKAIAYAQKNWNNGIGHCAAFAEKCLEAGGVYGLSDIGATTLYNQLMASGLGYAVRLTRDKDGSINAGDYAFPGDILFYYCPTDKRMVHAAVYNGSTKDGLARAYAHNPSDNGQNALKYSKFCPDDCGTEINTVALFCFYRNPQNLKTPDSLPVLTVRTKGNIAEFNWRADYLYNDSALTVKDKDGNEVYRSGMRNATGQSLIFYSTEEYTACVETYIGNVTVKSKEVKFSVPMATNKPAEAE